MCDEEDLCPGVDDNLDSDQDGTPNCLESCPDDPLKTEPGNCGCGVVDTPGSGVWDLDCDGDYDEDDVLLAMEEFDISAGTPGDVNGDGNVDLADRETLNQTLGLCAADINGDGEVNGADIGILLGAWGVCVP